MVDKVADAETTTTTTTGTIAFGGGEGDAEEEEEEEKRKRQFREASGLAKPKVETKSTVEAFSFDAFGF